MGIHGLRNFIRHHYKQGEFMKELSRYLSTECVLIIDTPNLLHRFHENIKLDSLCGGQYEELYQGLLQFFTSLREDWPCMRLILLLIEVTEEEKLDVVRDRKLCKMKEWVEAIDQAKPFSSLPLCAWDVLHEVVAVCGLQTLCYDSEADDFISALALHYTQQNTPAFILSSDTDFYLTVGITGILSLDNIVWRQTKPVLKETRFFSLKDFLRTTRCSPWMIPFLALLLGNDLTPTELKPALEHIKGQYSSVGRYHCFARLVFYLARYTKTENVTLANIRNELKSELVQTFDKTYVRNKQRYLNPLDVIPPEDIPTPQLSRMKGLYPGLSRQSLIRIAYLWNSRVLLVNKTSICAEDYKQPRAGLASLALRSYWHGVLLLPTQEVTGVELEPPKHVTEICRRKGLLSYTEDTTTLGNVITDEQLEVFYRVEGRSLPNLAQIQEMPQADRYELFLSIMHCSAVRALLLSNTELMDREVSVVLFTLYYWYHQISFKETKSPSKATPLSVLQRQELLVAMLSSALAVYFKDQLILDASKGPNLRAVTWHESYHSVAEWLSIQQDTNILLLVLDLPLFSIRRSYNGHILFRVLTDREFSISVQSQLSSLMGAELHNMRQALLTPYTYLE